MGKEIKEMMWKKMIIRRIGGNIGWDKYICDFVSYNFFKRYDFDI